ncbi:MAG: TetR/AcrR family transcriptional regulator [Fibrobacteria bacterium]|nr:TetR/AcrR family transcriptional regulator [Fibrobacteria bacterium]
MVKPNNQTKKSGEGVEIEKRLKSDDNSQNSQNIEEFILIAAQKEFIKFGLKGARMQAIADEAGVNKSLLHYYYRSKDKLYDAVIENILNKIQRTYKEQEAAHKPEGLKDNIRMIVTTYINIFSENPDFPLFLVHEIKTSRKPVPTILDMFINFISYMKENLFAGLSSEISKGTVKNIAPEQLLMNIMSLVLGPFFLRPVMDIIGPALNLPLEFDKSFYAQRIEVITDTVFNSIVKNEEGKA